MDRIHAPLTGAPTRPERRRAAARIRRAGTHAIAAGRITPGSPR